MKKIIALVFNLLVASLLTAAIGAPAILGVGAGLFSSAFTKNTSGVLPMGLQLEVWQRDIVENLFADNSFLSKAFNADMYVLQGKVVHIPQAGTPSAVVKNRSELPAAAVKRNDTEQSYSLDEYTTTPRLITDADKVELSYDMRQSVISEDKAALIEAVSNEFIYNWSPSGATNITRTTGDAVAAHLPSATGNRNSFTKADVKAVQLKMNKQGVDKANRYCLLDSDMYFQLLDSLSDKDELAFHSRADLAKGTIGQLYGFDFYERNVAGKYSNAATPLSKLWDAEGAATDNAAAIFWQQNCVERALGEVKAFDDAGNPTYYGDILSFLVRAGGRIRRGDSKGVVACVQAVPAG